MENQCICNFRSVVVKQNSSSCGKFDWGLFLSIETYTNLLRTSWEWAGVVIRSLFVSWEGWCFSLHSLLPVTMKSMTHNRTKIVNCTIFTLTYTSKIFCRDLTTDLERLVTFRVLCCVVSDLIFSDIWPLSHNRYQIPVMYRVNHKSHSLWPQLADSSSELSS